ncbi:hypothetical protein [Brasilonema sennae]|nr:hypothetical protein [Brasilonema sennae]
MNLLRHNIINEATVKRYIENSILLKLSNFKPLIRLGKYFQLGLN